MNKQTNALESLSHYQHRNLSHAGSELVRACRVLEAWLKM